MIYLIDFENTNSSGLDGLLNLTENDTVILIYSEKAHTIDIEIIDFFTKAKCNIKYLKTKRVSPNYLDFHISTIVGAYLYQGEPVAIISKDKGYVSVIDYWKTDFLFKRPQTVQMAESIATVKRKNLVNTIKAKLPDEEPKPEDKVSPEIEKQILYIQEDAEELLKDLKAKAQKTEKAETEPEKPKSPQKAVTKAQKRRLEKQKAAKPKTPALDTLTVEKNDAKAEGVKKTDIVEATDIEIQRLMTKSPTLDMYRFNLIDTFGRIEGEKLYTETAKNFKKKA